MKRTWVIALVAIGSFCVSETAQAAPVTINFAGVVTGVDASLGGTFSVGALLNGSYTFDPSTAARAGSNSTFAVFDALLGLHASVGSYSVSSASSSEIQVDNDPGGGFHDRYSVISRASQGLTGPSVNGFNLNAFGFRLDDATDSVFSNALNLPASVNLSDFTSSAFFFFFTDPTTGGLSVASGQLTSISVPEPTALVFAGIGLAGLLIPRRRARK